MSCSTFLAINNKWVDPLSPTFCCRSQCLMTHTLLSYIQLVAWHIHMMMISWCHRETNLSNRFHHLDTKDGHDHNILSLLCVHLCMVKDILLTLHVSDAYKCSTKHVKAWSVPWFLMTKYGLMSEVITDWNGPSQSYHHLFGAAQASMEREMPAGSRQCNTWALTHMDNALQRID